ncbi:hypothetical protein K1719_038373 [Acacia pycnantha]|nr:hypothetical protein K1719_038373 [Acacia pycnantha]
MAVDDDCFDLHDLESGDFVLPGFDDEFSESQLMVPLPPDDSLEDLTSLEDLPCEWFPEFSNDFITSNQITSDQPRMHGTVEMIRQRTNGTVNNDGLGISEYVISGFTKKKCRTMKAKARRSAVVIERKRCSHCKTEETPQWRYGPDGPKTLCNACGVRFKSGRLLPEYRPAASPSFDEDMHSNCHRKIMAKRRWHWQGSAYPPPADSSAPVPLIIWFGQGMKQTKYDRSESRLSDHRPVQAMFTVDIKIVGTSRPLNEFSKAVRPRD